VKFVQNVKLVQNVQGKKMKKNLLARGQFLLCRDMGVVGPPLDGASWLTSRDPDGRLVHQ
jgi:hypothetical protein